MSSFGSFHGSFWACWFIGGQNVTNELLCFELKTLATVQSKIWTLNASNIQSIVARLTRFLSQFWIPFKCPEIQTPDKQSWLAKIVCEFKLWSNVIRSAFRICDEFLYVCVKSIELFHPGVTHLLCAYNFFFFLLSRASVAPKSRQMSMRIA